MAGQEDLITEVQNKLKDYKEKERELDVAQTSFNDSKNDLESARTKLTDHMDNMRTLFDSVQVELGESPATVSQKALADSLSGSKTADEETIEEATKPSKTAAYDELDAPKKAGRKLSKASKIESVKDDEPGEQLISPALEEKLHEEIEKVVVSEIEENLDTKESTDNKVSALEDSSELEDNDDDLDKLLQSVKIPATKTVSSSGGLWDIDDEEDDDDLFGTPIKNKKNASNLKGGLSDSTDVDEVQF